MSLREPALALHKKNKGKIGVYAKVPLRNKEDLSLAYTPGVAEVCLEIAGNEKLAYEYTAKGNFVAVVSDGTAVLGLGDIGPCGAIPVMEGKCLLFKAYAGIDAIPICVRTKNVEEIVKLVKLLEPTLGGINLEDISSPRCFEIEERLKSEMSIPVFHDDQHGTAVVVLAAVINALKIVGKSIKKARFVLNGAGAAGIATANLLLDSGATEVILCDRLGVVYPGRPGTNVYKEKVARRGNINNVRGDLAVAIKGADVFIGLSGPRAVTVDMVSSMAEGAIVIPMANPVPEIYPEDAKLGGAAIVGTGRSDFPNQVNNVLAFPGIMRGALEAQAHTINEVMKVAAAHAIAGIVTESELSAEYVIPDPFDKRVAPSVARAVAVAAVKSGVAEIKIEPQQVYEKTAKMTGLV